MLLEKVLATTEYVVENSQGVKINQEKIPRSAEKVAQNKLPVFRKEYYFFGTPKETIQYFFILDSLQFCSFAEKGEEKWGIEVNGKKLSGYFSLALALKKAAGKYPLFNASYLSDIPLGDFKKIIGGQGKMPMLNHRWQILRKAGQVLLKEFNGQAINVVGKADKSAQKMVETLFKHFPYLRDIAELENKTIYFLKRAQIFVSSLWGAFDGRGYGHFRDIDKLTCFADYKIPQVLHSFGVLEYSPALLSKIRREELISAFSRQEIEIRANTIWAVEAIKKELKKQGINLPSFQIDWILWTLSKALPMKLPHHRTRTIFY